MMKKRFVFLALLLLLSGCSSPHTEAEIYLEEKYGENFTFQKITGGGWDSSTKYIFTSDSHPEDGITVRHIAEGVYRDNYAGIKYRERTEQLLRSILTECYGEDFFLIYVVNGMDTAFGATFEEYKKKVTMDFTAIVRYPLQDREEAVKKLEIAMTREFGQGSATIYFDEDIDLSFLTMDNYSASYLEKKTYDGRLHVFMSDPNEGFTTIKWN